MRFLPRLPEFNARQRWIIISLCLGLLAYSVYTLSLSPKFSWTTPPSSAMSNY